MSEDQPTAPRSTGVVKWFNGKKGFGFITPSDGGDDVFVHQSSIRVEGFRSLAEGAKVEYTSVDGQDGRRKAIQVTGPEGTRPRVGPRMPVNPQNRMAKFVAPAQQAVPYGPMMYPYSPMQYHGGWPNYIQQGPGMQPYPQAAPTFYMPGMMMHQTMAPMQGAQMAQQMGQMGPMQPSTAAPNPFKVVVHNVPWSTTSDDLQAAFSAWNPETADIVTDAVGQSRGYGLVSFGNHADLENAVSEMHGQDLGGRRVSVRPDRFW